MVKKRRREAAASLLFLFIFRKTGDVDADAVDLHAVVGGDEEVFAALM